MAYIKVQEGLPGIRGLMAFRPETDGQGTWAPADRQIYASRGRQRAEEGYANFNPFGK
jgi:hypothetical protein